MSHYFQDTVPLMLAITNYIVQLLLLKVKLFSQSVLVKGARLTAIGGNVEVPFRHLLYVV